MFIRDNLTQNTASKKKKDDEHARVRNQILKFRTTPEERKKLYMEQKASGTIRKAPKVGRNEPCPCGSGKKYKHCCGK